MLQTLTNYMINKISSVPVSLLQSNTALIKKPISIICQKGSCYDHLLKYQYLTTEVNINYKT